jgi:hypothetical protein
MVTKKNLKQKIGKNSLQILLSFLLVTSLLLSACSLNNNNAAADSTYTYQGKVINLPEDITYVMSLEKTAKDNLLLLGMCSSGDTFSALLWELTSSETWQERVDFYTLLPINSNYICTNAVITKNESVLSVFADTSEQNINYRFFLTNFTPEPKYQELQIHLPEIFNAQDKDETYSSLKSVLPISDDMFLIQDNLNNLFILNCKTETMAQVSLDELDASLAVSSVAKLNEQIFVLCEGVTEDESSIAIRMLDISTNTFSYLDDSLADTLMAPYKEHASLSNNGVIPSIESDPLQADRLIICTSAGIYEFKNEQMKKIVDAKETILANPLQLVIGCVFDNQDDFYLLSLAQAAAGASYTLYKYEQSEISSENKITLRVYSLEDSAGVRQAIAFYKEEHPNVEVVLEIGLNSNGMTYKDALQNLNTEMLAGTGPDILFLDGLPIETFVQRGLLYDLTDIYNDAIATGGYYENIMGTFLYDGSCRAIPTRFSFPLVVTDKSSADDLDSLSTLVNLAKTKVKSSPDTKLFCNISVIDDLLVAYYPKIIKQGTIDQNAITQFFQSIKELSVILESNENQRSVMPSFTNDSSQKEQSRDTFNDINYGKAEFVSDPHQILIFQPIQEQDLGELEAIKTIDEADVAVKLFSLTDNKCFLPKACVAINNNSGKIQLARAFIQTMLSDDYQNISQENGLSVQNSVFIKRTTETAYSITLQNGRRLFLRSVSDEAKADYKELFASLDTPVAIDEVIQETIYQELQRYLDGEATLESAIDSCNKKLSLYLVE